MDAVLMEYCQTCHGKLDLGNSVSGCSCKRDWRKMTDEHTAGFVYAHPDGRKFHVYLHPSSVDAGDEPNVFLYCGGTGDPAKDVAMYHITTGPTVQRKIFPERKAED